MGCFRLSGMVIYVCLLFVGLMRIILGLFPFRFHTLNHRALSSALIFFLTALPLVDTMVRFATCGHPCDANANVIIYGIYERNISVEKCKNAPYFLAFVVPSLILVYGIILFLEFYRKHTNVAPMMWSNNSQPSDPSDEAGRPTAAPHQNPAVFQARYEPTQRGSSLLPDMEIQTIGGVSQTVRSPAWQPVRHQHTTPGGLLPILPAPDPLAFKSKNLSRLVIRTGGVTFLAFLIFGVVAFSIYSLNYYWAVSILVRCGSLFTNLPWYWISVDDNIRSATDTMMRNVIKKLLCQSL